jgi:hypothetical protein
MAGLLASITYFADTKRWLSSSSSESNWDPYSNYIWIDALQDSFWNSCGLDPACESFFYSPQQMDAWEPLESRTPAAQITMSKNKYTKHYMYIMGNNIGLRYIRPFVTKCSFISVEVHADPWKLWWKSYYAYFLGWQKRPVCFKAHDRSMWSSAPIIST